MRARHFDALLLVALHIMKKLLFFPLFVLSLLIVSCSGNKQEAQPTAHEAFVSELSTQDTVVVLQLCENFLQAMKENDKDKAFSILRYVEDGKVLPPTTEQMAKLSNQFTIFPVLDYHIKDFKVGEATDNICSYSIVISVDDEGKESTISFGFCPVKVDGQWYITVRNASAKLPQ